MLAVLVIAGGWILITLIRVQRAINKVDFSDWLIDSSGKAAWSKASAIGGWLVGTWCMIYITLSGKVPENYIELYLVYFLIVIGNPAAMDLLRRWRPLPSDSPPSQPEVKP